MGERERRGTKPWSSIVPDTSDARPGGAEGAGAPTATVTRSCRTVAPPSHSVRVQLAQRQQRLALPVEHLPHAHLGRILEALGAAAGPQLLVRHVAALRRHHLGLGL